METIKRVRVQNMPSLRLPMKRIANQFIIDTPEGTYFQSYESTIAFVPANQESEGAKIVLDAAKWDYSVTTGKYRNNFLGESKKETAAKIKSGEYILADLNEPS